MPHFLHSFGGFEMMNRKRVFPWILMTTLLMVGISLPGLSQAAYPKKTITTVMPFGSGGTGDIILRFLGDVMKQDLGVPVVVVNKPGSGGAVGWTLLQAKKADGYHIGYASNSLFTATHRTKGSVNYKNFTPIVMLNSTPFAITVNAKSPWKKLSEFVKYAKENPGKVRVGNSGAAGIWHLSALLFEKKAGVKFTHVPYKGGAKAAAALLGGHIEATSVTVGDMSSLLPTGKLRVLAIGGDKRDPFYPNVPTVKEAGVDLVMSNWRGVVAPKGLSKDRLAVLGKAFEKAVNDPKYVAFMKQKKLISVFKGPQEFGEFYFEAGKNLINVLKEMK